MKRWLQFHFLDSRGYTTYVHKLNMEILSSAIGVCSIALQHILLSFSCLTDAFLNVFGPFLLCFLTFLFQPHSSLHLLSPFFCPQRRLSACVFPSLSKLGLSVSDIATVYERRHRHSKDKRQHLLQRKFRRLLDPGCNKRQEHSTVNGCSKLHLQQRWQTLFLSVCLSLIHTHTHSRLLGKQGRQALQWRRNACPVWAYTLSRAPNCSDKYEMVEMGDKGSWELSSHEHGEGGGCLMGLIQKNIN